MAVKKPSTKGLGIYLALLLAFLLLATTLFSQSSTQQLIKYSKVLEYFENGQVSEFDLNLGSGNMTMLVEINGKKTEVNYRVPNVSRFLDDIDDDIEAYNGAHPDSKMVYDLEPAAEIPWFVSMLPTLILVGSMGIFLYVMMRQTRGSGGMSGFSKAKPRTPQDGRIVTFADVAGADEEKEELVEIVEFLKNPAKYNALGARIPKGVLLMGPPGTGKTLLARAVAGEAGVPFYSISGSDFVEMFVGVGASRVRDLFKKAQENAPCIVFIDEIDAIGKSRDSRFGGGNDEREQTLNQLLVEMDGITDNAGIVVIAATNRPDVLDPALLRPGRFDRQITVSLPDRRGRKAILEVHARNKKLAPEIDLDALAKRTPGFSGADLENVLNEAAILAVRENSDLIHMHNLDEAIDRVMMGPAKKSRKYDEKSKKLVAYHESGHAIVGLNLENSNIVQKVTIIPRGTAGGYNLMTPKEEKIMNTKNDLMSAITGYMGGRVAEEVFFDDITTGAVNDIEQATKMARDMVTLYGMSDLGPVQYDHGQQNVFLGRDYNSSSNVSGQVAFEIDQEIRKIIDQCHDEAKKIILEHKEELIKIAEALIENETLTAEQIDKIIKGEPFLDLPTPEMKAAAASVAEPESPVMVETEETSQPETETE